MSKRMGISRYFLRIPPVELFQRLTRHFGLRFPCETTQSLDLLYVKTKLQYFQKHKHTTDFWEVLEELHSYYIPHLAPKECLNPLELTPEKMYIILRHIIRFYDYNVIFKTRSVGKSCRERSMLIIPTVFHPNKNLIEVHSLENIPIPQSKLETNYYLKPKTIVPYQRPEFNECKETKLVEVPSLDCSGNRILVDLESIFPGAIALDN
jgi:hypothetical protein